MTYLGVVLDHKLNWTQHIQSKVSKANFCLALIKPAINHIYGLNPKRMQWIWKQILLPRLTYGCHVWGHSLTQHHKSLIKTVERLALKYYAPMWKTTPTASLQVILNQKPSHIEVKGVCIRSYMHIKNLFQKIFGMASLTIGGQIVTLQPSNPTHMILSMREFPWIILQNQLFEGTFI